MYNQKPITCNSSTRETNSISSKREGRRYRKNELLKYQRMTVFFRKRPNRSSSQSQDSCRNLPVLLSWIYVENLSRIPSVIPPGFLLKKSSTYSSRNSSCNSFANFFKYHLKILPKFRSGIQKFPPSPRHFIGDSNF